MNATTNGRGRLTPERSAQIREGLRAKVADALAAGKPRTAKRLLESLWMWDDFGGSDLWDKIRPSQNDDVGGPWVPISVPSDRRHGANWPLWRTQQELDWLRQESRIRCQSNAFAQGLIANRTNNVIGKGFTYKVMLLGEDGKPATEEELTDEGKAYVGKVQERVDGFLRLNNWNGGIDSKGVGVIAGTREREIYRTVLIDGECFLRFHFQDNGDTLVRFVDAAQIRDNKNAPQDGWFLGIQHAMEPFEDVETPVAYSVYWPDPSAKGGEGDSADAGDLYDEIDASEILHLKGPDTPATVKRGTPELIYDAGRALDRAARLAKNLSAGAAIRAAIAETWQYDQATQMQIASMASALAVRQVTNSVTGENEFLERYPPGTIRRGPTGATKVEPGADNTPAYRQGVAGDLQQASAASCSPAFWLGDTENANYSNLESASAPAVRQGVCEQEYYKAGCCRSVWKAVEWAASCGELPSDVADKVIIQVEAPAVLHRNELEKAQEDQISVTMGWKDRQTCAAERGLDWKVVEANNEEFQEKQMEMMPDLPMPGEGGGGSGANGSGGAPKPSKPALPKGGETRAQRESKDAEGHEHDSHSGEFTGTNDTAKASQKHYRKTMAAVGEKFSHAGPYHLPLKHPDRDHLRDVADGADELTRSPTVPLRVKVSAWRALARQAAESLRKTPEDDVQGRQALKATVRMAQDAAARVVELDKSYEPPEP